MKKLRPIEDAHGQEIWTYYNSKEVPEIVENYGGYISVSLFGARAIKVCSFLIQSKVYLFWCEEGDRKAQFTFE